MDSQELTLEIHIMPCKHAVTISMSMNDTIATIKKRISEQIDYPVEELKIVNAGRICDDNSTVEKNGLNYCSRVICIAKNYVPPEGSGETGSVLLTSKLLIKMDGSNSKNVPYNASTTWRQLKLTLQRMVNIDPLDFTILLNNNVVDYNDLVVNAHVNYMSVIHAVRRDFSYVITKPLEQSMIYLHCQHCHQFNPHYVIRPICSDCQQGCVTYLDQPFQLEHTPARLCFQLRGKCQYFMCRKFKKEQCLSLAFICKNCEEVSNERNVLFVLRATSDIEVMKQQLNKLYGYLTVTAAQDKNARTGL